MNSAEPRTVCSAPLVVSALDHGGGASIGKALGRATQPVVNRLRCCDREANAPGSGVTGGDSGGQVTQRLPNFNIGSDGRSDAEIPRSGSDRAEQDDVSRESLEAMDVGAAQQLWICHHEGGR